MLNFRKDYAGNLWCFVVQTERQIISTCLQWCAVSFLDSSDANTISSQLKTFRRYITFSVSKGHFSPRISLIELFRIDPNFASSAFWRRTRFASNLKYILAILFPIQKSIWISDSFVQFLRRYYSGQLRTVGSSSDRRLLDCNLRITTPKGRTGADHGRTARLPNTQTVADSNEDINSPRGAAGPPAAATAACVRSQLPRTCASLSNVAFI